jgi:hypothetical protein
MNTNSKSTKYWRIKLIKKKEAKDNSIERKKNWKMELKKKETICHCY